MEGGMMDMEIVANFWRANFLRCIRVGIWRHNGTFHTLATIRLAGAEYSDAEAKRAKALAQRMQRRYLLMELA
jgi:hypothetical protein